jgi:hypothetical protein
MFKERKDTEILSTKYPINTHELRFWYANGSPFYAIRGKWSSYLHVLK